MWVEALEGRQNVDGSTMIGVLVLVAARRPARDKAHTSPPQGSLSPSATAVSGRPLLTVAMVVRMIIAAIREAMAVWGTLGLRPLFPLGCNFGSVDGPGGLKHRAYHLAACAEYRSQDL